MVWLAVRFVALREKPRSKLCKVGRRALPPTSPWAAKALTGIPLKVLRAKRLLKAPLVVSQAAPSMLLWASAKVLRPRNSRRRLRPLLLGNPLPGHRRVVLRPRPPLLSMTRKGRRSVRPMLKPSWTWATTPRPSPRCLSLKSRGLSPGASWPRSTFLRPPLLLLRPPRLRPL